MSSIVVIGSNSFSAGHFIDYVLSTTSYDVIAVSRSSEKSALYLPYKNNKEASRVTFHQLDLNTDSEAIVELVKSSQSPYVVNFASQSMVGESWDHPDHWYQTNVVSTVHLCEGLRKLESLKKYVHISTPEVYGHCSGKVTEEHAHNPSTPYAGSRSAADVYLMMLVKTFNFPAVFTRASNVYGPGQQLFKIIPRSIVYMKKGKKIPLHGGGVARRNFIHMKDVSDATVRVMEQAKPGEVYHISAPDLISIKDLVADIASGLGVSFDDSVDMVDRRLGLDDAYILDATKAITTLGWKPTIDLKAGIAEVVAWVNDNWDEISQEPLEYIHKQ